MSDNEAIPAQLERSLRAANPGKAFSVLNLGVSGYGTDQSFLRFILDGRAFDPKVVVFIHFPNDPWDVARVFNYGVNKPFMSFDDNDRLCLNGLPVDPGPFAFLESGAQLQKRSVAFAVAKSLVRRFFRKPAVAARLALIEKYIDCIGHSSTPDVRPDFFPRLVLRLDELLRADGRQVIHVFIHNNRSFPAREPQLRYDVAQKQLVNRRVPVIDSYSLLLASGMSNLQIRSTPTDVNHLGAKANRLIAEAIAVKVLELLE